MGSALVWVGVFFATACIDAVWVFWAENVKRRNAGRAALWSSVLVLLSGSVAIGYVNDPWLLIPAAGGAYIGTLLALVFVS